MVGYRLTGRCQPTCEPAFHSLLYNVTIGNIADEIGSVKSVG